MAMSAPLQKPVVIAPDDGTVFRAFGDEVTVKINGEHTGKSLALCVTVTAPGAGPPPHYHANEDELFVVQQGRVGFFVDGRWIEQGPGAVVYIPRGNVHTFRNVGETESRMLVITTPSGFETFFSRCAAEFCRDGGPDMSRIVAISGEHGIYFVEGQAPAQPG